MIRTASAALLFVLACALAPAAAQTPHSHQHGFHGAENWAHVFDDPKRDATQKPHQVIQALALKPDAIVADIGSGTGYFAVRLAHFVPQGRVYGADIEPDMVKHLAERAKREKLDNLVAIAAAPDDARLPEKVDLALLVNVYHHIADRAPYLKKLKASMKPGGRIAIIDFRMDSPAGPPKSARLAPQKIRDELAGAGFTLREEHAFLPQQHFLVFAADGR